MDGDRPQRDPDETWARFGVLMEERFAARPSAGAPARDRVAAPPLGVAGPPRAEARRAEPETRPPAPGRAAESAGRPLRAFVLGGVSCAGLLAAVVATAAIAPRVPIPEVGRWLGRSPAVLEAAEIVAAPADEPAPPPVSAPGSAPLSAPAPKHVAEPPVAVWKAPAWMAPEASRERDAAGPPALLAAVPPELDPPQPDLALPPLVDVALLRRRGAELAALARAREEAERHALAAREAAAGDAAASREDELDQDARGPFVLGPVTSRGVHSEPAAAPMALDLASPAFLEPAVRDLAAFAPALGATERREARPAPPGAAPSAGPAPPTRGGAPTVVLEYAGGAQVGIQLKRAVEAAGFRRVVLRSSFAPVRRTQVRYYFDEDAPAAGRLAAALGAGAPSKQTRWVMRPAPGVIEAAVAGGRR